MIMRLLAQHCLYLGLQQRYRFRFKPSGELDYYIYYTHYVRSTRVNNYSTFLNIIFYTLRNNI
jgi:hypothetical protein